MKIQLLVFPAFILLLNNLPAFAQCTSNNSGTACTAGGGTSTGTITPTGAWQFVTFPNTGTRYYEFTNAVSGRVYEFATATSQNMELTIYAATGTANLRQYDQNNDCSSCTSGLTPNTNDEYATYVTASTANHRVRLSQHGNCSNLANNGNRRLYYRCLSPIIQTQPVASAICAGGNTTFTVTATAPTLSYQWRRNGTNITNGGIYSGATTATLTITGAATTDAGSFDVVVTGTCGPTATSTAVALTVATAPVTTAPSITNATICAGGSTVVSTTPSGGAGTFSYQWQYNNGGTWANVANGTPAGAAYTNATSASMTIASISAAGTYTYRCIVSQTGAGCGTVTSATVSLTVVSDPVAQTISASSSNGTVMCVGGTASATFSGGSGGAGTVTDIYEYLNTGSTWLAYTPGNNITFNTAGTTFGFRTRRSATGSGCTNPTANNTVIYTIAADPSVSTQPVAATICTGGTRVITAAVSNGTGLSYQWEESTDNGVSDPWANASGGSGATTLSYTTPALSANMYYRLRINSTGLGCTNPAYSNAVLTTVLADPVTTTPSITNASICAGGSTVVSTTPSGGTGTFSYQWQYNNGGTWANVANGTPTGAAYTNATSASMTIASISAAGSYDYRCNVSQTGAGCGTVTSATVSLTVVADPVAQTISASSSNGTVMCVGGTASATFSGGSGGTGTVTDIYEYLNTGSTWLAYTPGNNITFNTAGTTFGFRTRRSATGSGCTNPTANNTVIYTIVADPSVSTQPVAATICTGGTRVITAAVSNGTGLSYQWEESTDNGVSDPWANASGGSGATTLSYTTPALSANMYYRLRINSTGLGCTNPSYSNAVLTTVLADPVTTTPSITNASICAGGSTVVSTTPSGGTGTFSYQWQYNNGGTWANVANGTPTGAVYTNATSASMTIASISAAGSYDYRCNVSQTGAGCGPVTSATVSLTVVADPVAQTISASSSNGTVMCVGGTASATFSGGSGGAGTVTDIYEYLNTGSTWLAYTPGNNITFNTAGTTFGFRTRRSATGSGCTNPTANNTVIYTIVADPSVSTQPVAATICTGGTRVITAAVSNGTGLTYQWEESTDNGVSDPWANASGGSGATTLSYTTPALSANMYYRLRINSTGLGCTNPAYSNAVLTTVLADPTTTTPSITNASICAGGSTVVSTTPSGGTGTFSYQWQYNNGGTWANVANGTPTGAAYTNATSASMTIASISAAGSYDYRCNVSQTGAGCGPVTSATVSLTVVADPVAQTISASSSNGTVMCIGGTASATFSGGSGGAGTVTDIYEYLNTGSTWLAYTPGNNITFNTAGTTFGFRTRRSATGSGCTNPTGNNTVIYTIVADPSVSTQPVAATICTGGTRVITAVVSNGTGLSYQWEESTDNGVSDPWANASGGSGATTLSYTTPALSANMYYRLRINSTGLGCTNPAYSNAVLTTVLADPTTTTPSITNASICAGGSTVVSTTPSGGTGTFSYQWQYNNGGTWANVANGTPTGAAYTNATSASMTIASISAAGSYSYRCIVSQTGAGCGPVTSATRTLTVVTDPTAPTLHTATPPTNTTLCTGETASITVNTFTDGTGTCTNEYQYTVNGGTTWLAYTPGNSITAGAEGAAMVRIQSRRVCSGSGCDGSGETYATIASWEVFCGCGTVNNNDGTIAASCNAFGTEVSTATYAYRTMTVVNGVDYTFSTCGTTPSSFDSELTIRNNSNSYMASNDNNGTQCSGNRASLDWTATFSGTARIYVHRNNCEASWSGTSALLKARQNTTVNNTTLTTAICIGDTKPLTATLGGAHNNPAVTWSIVSGGGSITGTTYTPSSTGSKTIRATVGLCTDDVIFTVNPLPAITPGTNPTVCAGSTSANLTYTAATNSPNRYSIDYNSAAQAQGFTDVTNATLPTSPIVLTVPSAASTGNYTGILTVTNSTTGCTSANYTVIITVSGPQSATTWNGSIDTDWFKPGNWSNCVPGNTTDATVPNTTNKPRIATSLTGFCRTITINSSAGARLDIQGTGALIVNP